MDVTPEFLQWALGQGVAVAVLAFVLLRVDAKLTTLVNRMDVLIAILTTAPPRGTE